MFVLSKRNIILPSPDGSVSVRLRRGDLVDPPDWAAKTDYCKALIADGELGVRDRSDKSTQAADEKKVKTRRGKETTEE